MVRGGEPMGTLVFIAGAAGESGGQSVRGTAPGKGSRMSGNFCKPVGLGTVGAVALLAAAAAMPLAFGPSKVEATQTGGADRFANLPSSLQLTGVVRDFRGRNETGGHPDFQYQPTRGFGHYAELVADELDSEGKPVFRSTGKKVTGQAADASNRNIMPGSKSYIQSRTGDRAATMESQAGGALSTRENFAQWFRDVPGVNVSKQVPVTLVRQANTNMYTFNDRTDALYSSRGGFFPINGELFGNTPGQDKNFGFTFELTTAFVYQRGTGQVFTFTGDDDVFVFIGGKLVVDLGGVHGAISQTIDLDRLTHLQDGQRYELKLLFAERHTTQSNVRIDTTISLQPADLPTTTALSD